MNDQISKRVGNVVQILLAHNEHSSQVMGNGEPVMDYVAREYLEANPNIDYVEVFECGGYWKQYARGLDEGKVMVIGPHNRLPRSSPEAKKFWSRFNDTVYSGLIRRGIEPNRMRG